MSESHRALKKLQQRFPDAITDVREFRGEVTAYVPKKMILDICRFLRDDSDLQYGFLTDLCAVDFFPDSPRFEVVYLITSMVNRERLRLKVKIEEGESVPSVVSVWNGANWLEREVYDMFGITFENHPDLRRILLWDGFEGHPLRKDFPVEGPDFDRPFVPEV